MMSKIKIHKFWSPKKIAVPVAKILRGESYTCRDIARRLGDHTTYSAVRKLCLKFDETNSVTDKCRIDLTVLQ